jgi:3-oxoacyl-[acyl-carrier-protein] synthase II
MNGTSRIPVITGIGLVTPLGNNAAQTWDALLAGRHIRDHARTMLDGTSADRIHRLAETAADEALREAGWRERGAAEGRTATVVGTSKGAIETWMTAPPDISDSTYVSAGVQCQAFGLAEVATALRAKFPLLDGPTLTISAACASGLHAVIRAAMMIRGGEADRVLVVAAEASVHPLFLASFNRLGVLPPEGFGCRPFDEDRQGFLMSEAAAAVCLENVESNRSLPQAYARIDRFALGGDATHMTGGDPSGSTLRNLLARVVDNRPVELIHAHGTGTTFNDPIELAAFDDLCAHDSALSIYSHKGALGHSLGAAGLVSAALNCMMHAKRVIPPNVQTKKPLATRGVRITIDAKAQATRRSICVAAGFGGPTAVISLVSA